MPRTALIVGVGGQDGAYLARHLLGLGQRVAGTTRHAAMPANLDRLGIAAQVDLHRLNVRDGDTIERLLCTVAPDDIYWLAGESSVAASFAHPAGGLETAAGLLLLLESIRRHIPAARTMFAASGECFGETGACNPARETSPFSPRNPYAVGKCAGHDVISYARSTLGLFACSAFLFNHESPLRPSSFVIAKLAGAVRRIAAGSTERLQLGDCDVVRDWGWAPDYVIAMQRMVALDAPRDLVIATGASRRLVDLVADAFALIDRDWRDHVDIAAHTPRPGDARSHVADPALARALIGWTASADAAEVLSRLILDPSDTAARQP